MTPKQFLAATAVLLGVGLLWRYVSVESDVAALRTELAKTQAALSAQAEGGRENLPAASFERPGKNLAFERDSKSANPTGAERTLEELQQARVRIAELEGVVDELSDAWNQFAADEEARRAEAAMRENLLEQGGVMFDLDNDGTLELVDSRMRVLQETTFRSGSLNRADVRREAPTNRK